MTSVLVGAEGNSNGVVATQLIGNKYYGLAKITTILCRFAVATFSLRQQFRTHSNLNPPHKALQKSVYACCCAKNLRGNNRNLAQRYSNPAITRKDKNRRFRVFYRRLPSCLCFEGASQTFNLCK